MLRPRPAGTCTKPDAPTAGGGPPGWIAYGPAVPRPTPSNDAGDLDQSDDGLGRERLTPFDPRHLAALVEVARTGSFRVAGERLGYVQSAVSRQIATLEEVAGMRLVERARGANSEVRLTHAGEVLFSHAEALLTRQVAARADLAQLAEGTSGAVRVGLLQGVGHRLLRPAVAAYRRRRPGARVQASEFPSDVPLFELVEQGQLDLGLASMPPPPGPFEWRELLRVRWVLAMPAGWRVPRHEHDVRLADLAGRPLIGRHDERAGPSLETHVEHAGAEANVVFRTDIDETTRGLVAAGVGAALLPSFAVADDDPAIAVASLEDVEPAQVVGLFWHEERLLSPAAIELRAMTIEVCGRLESARAPEDER